MWDEIVQKKNIKFTMMDLKVNKVIISNLFGKMYNYYYNGE